MDQRYTRGQSKMYESRLNPNATPYEHYNFESNRSPERYDSMGHSHYDRSMRNSASIGRTSRQFESNFEASPRYSRRSYLRPLDAVDRYLGNFGRCFEVGRKENSWQRRLAECAMLNNARRRSKQKYDKRHNMPGSSSSKKRERESVDVSPFFRKENAARQKSLSYGSYCFFKPSKRFEKENLKFDDLKYHFTVEESMLKNKLDTHIMFNKAFLVHLYSGTTYNFVRIGESAILIESPRPNETICQGRVVGLGKDNKFMSCEKDFAKATVFVISQDKQKLIGLAQKKLQSLSPQKLRRHEQLRANFEMVNGISKFSTRVTYFQIRGQSHLILLHEHLSQPEVLKHISKVKCVVQLKHEKRRKGLAFFVQTTGAEYELEKKLSELQDRLNTAIGEVAVLAATEERASVAEWCFNAIRSDETSIERIPEDVRKTIKLSKWIVHVFDLKKSIKSCKADLGLARSPEELKLKIQDLEAARESASEAETEKIEKQLEKLLELSTTATDNMRKVLDSLKNNPYFGVPFIFKSRQHIETLYRIRREIVDIWEAHIAVGNTKQLKRWITRANQAHTSYEVDTYFAAEKARQRSIFLGRNHLLYMFLRGAKSIDDVNDEFIRKKLPPCEERNPMKSMLVREIASATIDALVEAFPTQNLTSDALFGGADYLDMLNRRKTSELIKHREKHRNIAENPNTIIRSYLKQSKADENSNQLKIFRETFNIPLESPMKQSEEVSMRLEVLETLNHLADHAKVNLHPKKVDVEKLRFVSPNDRARIMTDHNEQVTKLDPALQYEIRKYGEDAHLNNCVEWENFNNGTIAKLNKALKKKNVKQVDILLTFCVESTPKSRWTGCRVFWNNVNHYTPADR